MSILGPRPLLPSYLPWYTERERHRHDVRPGLSGLAQVNGRNYLDWDKRFELDVQYTEKITFLGDMKIIFQTLAIVNVVGSSIAREADKVFYTWRTQKYWNILLQISGK